MRTLGQTCDAPDRDGVACLAEYTSLQQHFYYVTYAHLDHFRRHLALEALDQEICSLLSTCRSC